MAKINDRIKVQENFEPTGTFDCITAILENFKNRVPYGPYTIINGADCGYYDDYASFDFRMQGFRDPTEKELDKRRKNACKAKIARENKKAKEEALEKEQYLKLKAKFEPKENRIYP